MVYFTFQDLMIFGIYTGITDVHFSEQKSNLLIEKPPL